jgi:hypothetical protein
MLETQRKERKESKLNKWYKTMYRILTYAVFVGPPKEMYYFNPVDTLQVV